MACDLHLWVAMQGLSVFLGLFQPSHMAEDSRLPSPGSILQPPCPVTLAKLSELTGIHLTPTITFPSLSRGEKSSSTRPNGESFLHKFALNPAFSEPHNRKLQKKLVCGEDAQNSKRQ